MRDLAWRLERESKPITGIARPGFDHGAGWRCIERAVDLDAVEPPSVEFQEIFTLQILRVELSLPSRVAEP